MLLQTVLYLTSVVSAIALIALILVQDRPAEERTEASEGALSGLRRATAWSTGLFLTSALLIALADVRTTGSLLDHVDGPRQAGVAAASSTPSAFHEASAISAVVDPLPR